MTHSKPFRCCTAIAIVALLADRASAQILTENAGPVSPEVPILRESVSFFESENLRETRLTSQFTFAFDKARDLELTLPFVYRESSFDGAGPQEEHAANFGLGDVSLRYKQALWRADDVMASTRLSFLVDLGVPTGESDATENGIEIPRNLQLGTGDWSFGGGPVFTAIRDRHRFSIEALYHQRTRHEGSRLGATADLDLAYWYRLRPEAFDPDEQTTEVRGVVELLSSYHFPSELGDATQDDEGTLIWLAPGIQVFPGTDVLFEANIQLPLYQDVDDDLGDRDWAATLVLKFLF